MSSERVYTASIYTAAIDHTCMLQVVAPTQQ